MGDFQGHPFRGNQYTEGVGVGEPTGAFKPGEALDKTRAEIRRDYESGVFGPTKAGVSRNQRDAAVALGYATRGATVADLAMAERMEAAGGRAGMLEAYGSQENWHQSPLAATREWEAAQALGAVAGGKDTFSKALATEIEKSEPLNPEAIKAFEERQRAHQDHFRETQKDAMDKDGYITVYRGIKGAQASKMTKELDARREADMPHRLASARAAEAAWDAKTDAERGAALYQAAKAAREEAGPDTYEGEKRGDYAFQQVMDAGLSGGRQRAYEAGFRSYVGREQEPLELGVRGLASWTTSSGDANDFAGPNGHIVATRIKASDVWMQTGLGSRGVIRYMEDATEIVTMNKTATRTVTHVRRGSKIHRRSGSGFLGYSK